MKTGTHEAESLVEIFLAFALSVAAAQLDTLSKEFSDMQRTGHDVDILVGNVIFQSSLLVNGQLHALVNGASQASVILAGILVVRVVLGVVNVVCIARLAGFLIYSCIVPIDLPSGL